MIAATLIAEQTSGNADAPVFCGPSCIEDLRGLYDRCGFNNPNPVEAREFVYNYILIDDMHDIAVNNKQHFSRLCSL